MIKITLHQAPDINYQITQAAIDQGKIIALRGLKGLDGNGGDLVAEISTRAAADISLSTSASTEISVRAAADTSLSTSVSTATSARASADASLTAAAVSEIATRSAAVTSLSTSVSTENSTRAAADISLSTAAINEASTRTAADTSLSTSVSAEISNRVVADASIVTGLVNKADLVGGKVPSIQLPSFVDDVLEYANFAALPVTGETGKLYITIDNNKQFRWSGTAYSEITSSPGSTDAVPEGATNKYFTDGRAIAALAAINSSEASTRAAADTSLSTAVSTEMSVRAVADTSQSTAAAAEIAARSAADTALSTAVSTETSRALAAEAGKAPSSHTHNAAGIDDGAITNPKLANVPTATVKGRKTAGTGVPEDLTMTELTALLNTFTSALKGLVPPSGGGTANFMRADGTWAAPTAAAGSGATELVQAIDAVGVASVAFTLPAGYSLFEIQCEDMHASTVTNLKMQVSTDLGVTWDTAAQYASAGNRQAGSLLYFGQNSQTSWDLAEYVTNSGSGKNLLHCWLYGARDATNHFKMRSWASYSNVVAYNGRHADMTHVRASLTAVNAVKLYLASGNLTGKFRLIGTKT